MATISRLLKIIGLSCRISSLSQGSFAKETYNFKDPTNHSHSRATRRQHACNASTVHDQNGLLHSAKEPYLCSDLVAVAANAELENTGPQRE